MTIHQRTIEFTMNDVGSVPAAIHETAASVDPDARIVALTSLPAPLSGSLRFLMVVEFAATGKGPS